MLAIFPPTPGCRSSPLSESSYRCTIARLQKSGETPRSFLGFASVVSVFAWSSVSWPMAMALAHPCRNGPFSVDYYTRVPAPVLTAVIDGRAGC